MLRGWRMNMLMAAACAAIVCGGGRTFAQPVDVSAASLRLLQQAVTSHRDGRNLSLLFALRQLRDPGLEPLFVKLLDHPQWQVQVHAVLGLAEIDERRRVDASLLERVAAPAQNAIVATALDLDLLPVEQIREALSSESLPPMSRIVLLAELHVLGEALDRHALQALAAGPDDHVAGLAACLLAQLGESGALTEYRSRLGALEARRRLEVELWLVEAIRRYKLTRCLEWVRQMIDDAGRESELASRGVLAMLELKHDSAAALWTRHLGENATYQHRVRCGLLLLMSDSAPSAALYDRLRPGADEELLAKIIAVGKAIASGGDPAPALIALLDLHHARTSEWAIERLAKLPPAHAARVYAHLIDRVARPEGQSGDSVALAVRAVARLYAIDAEAVLERLRQAEDDSVLQQSILLGLFEIHSSEVGSAAASLRRIGSGRADSLALVLMARNLPKLDPAEITQLGKVAAGGGRLSEVLQVQAAWLYLKSMNKTNTMLASLFPESP